MKNNITRIYVTALALIALVISISQFLVQTSIKGNESDSRIINISGRQRMLSQKISKAALSISKSQSEMDFVVSKKELQNALEVWQKSHEGLIGGSEEMGLSTENNTQKILSLYAQMDPYYKEILTSAKSLLALNSFADFDNTAEAGIQLESILANEGDFLKLMNNIVFEYDNIATTKIESLALIEYILYAIAVVMLLLV
ncbi:MAG: type IV pili methyl-accepting chemotaxis transducer N-terminal domain-containing protein, partial [Cyclobacteriaceae bacterium]